MPNRILRDWTDSETVDKLDVYAERFLTRLIMKVDDFGRYSANVKLLKSQLFPLKTDIREADISRWLAACAQLGLITLYNVANRELLQIENFNQRLRQKKEKYPSPNNDGQPPDNSQSDVGLKRNENENEVEAGKPVNNDPFFEFFRRAAGRHITDAELNDEIGRFKNKYPNLHLNKAGGLINAWVSNIGKEQPQRKQMVI